MSQTETQAKYQRKPGELVCDEPKSDELDMFGEMDGPHPHVLG